MKHVSRWAIRRAIAELRASIHPFVGVTFLACKRFGLPVGETARVKIDDLSREHLKRHHRLDPDSAYFFVPFGSPSAWVAGDYASFDLKAFRALQFKDVFLHRRGSDHWGFAENYVDRITSALKGHGFRRAPLPAVAFWLAKDRQWSPDATLNHVVDDFVRRYRITDYERRNLFLPASSLRTKVHTGFSGKSLFQPEPLDLKLIAGHMEPPPDENVQEGVLAAIETTGVGPADRLRLDLGKRLTVVAGDNGLGKSFLLDIAWWAATGHWSDRPAMPFGQEATDRALLSYELATDNGPRSCYNRFNPALQGWIQERGYPQVPALCVYAGANGAFSVADDSSDDIGNTVHSFTAKEVWSGKNGQIEGLCRDWITWQLSSTDLFSTFENILLHLSPPDLGGLRPSGSDRIPGHRGMVPLVRHPYGAIPILYASAGVRRIMALTYMVVWAWQENRLASKRKGVAPAQRLVLLVDEIDAHLHPFWQRVILPAILDIGSVFDEKLDMQVIVSTHSPFVLASLETKFDEKTDALYHLRLDGAKVYLEEKEFYKRGDVSSWLTSPMFGLRYPRTVWAEKAIDRAVQLQLDRSTNLAEIQKATNELMKVLPPDDSFWRRWTYFAKQAGATV